jgi:cytochrome P450
MGRETPVERASPPAPHTAAFYAIEAHSMLELEPPRHTRLRALVLRAFTSRRIKALAPEIEALCHHLIDGFAPEVDLLTAYGQSVPVIVIARLLGVPDSMAPQLLTWSNAMVGMYQAARTPAMEQAANTAARDFADFLRGYVEQRRTRPADDLITHLITAEQDGARLSTEELISTCILLLNAGHEATVHTLGNGVKSLLEAGLGGEVLTEARAEHTVEDILRFDAPLHMFTRFCYETVTIFGHDFKCGDQVACLLAAANRDPAAYPQAARLLATQPAKPQLGFGAGLHFCVGAPLARLELRIALRCLLHRLPHLRLQGTPQYADVYHFHGLKSLWVTP